MYIIKKEKMNTYLNYNEIDICHAFKYNFKIFLNY